MSKPICVKDELPPVHEEVWAYVNFSNGHSYWTESWCDETGQWAMGSAKNFVVTHWMNPPAAPKVKR